MSKLKELNDQQPAVYCPRARAMKKWVDEKVLIKVYEKDNRQPNSATCCVS